MNEEKIKTIINKTNIEVLYKVEFKVVFNKTEEAANVYNNYKNKYIENHANFRTKN